MHINSAIVMIVFSATRINETKAKRERERERTHKREIIPSVKAEGLH